MPGPIRAAGALLVAAAVLVLGEACTAAGDVDPAKSAPAPAAAQPATTETTTASPAPTPGISQAVPAPVGAVASARSTELRPVRISVPSIGVEASMTDLGIAGDGSIQVPTDVRQAGWVDTTPAPGEQGPAVVAGHVDSTTGPAVFYRLSSLTAGDAITITRRDGSDVQFTVDAVHVYAKNRFPSAAVYGPVPVPALRLITCGGDYVKSRGGYQDNVVVFAS